MTLIPALAGFVLAAGLLTLTPGLDTALVLRTATVEGRRPALLAALGVGLGCLAWGAITALGLGALLAASETGYRLLKWAGCGYLAWLGLKLILKPRSALAPSAAAPAGAPRPNWLARGLLTNLLNPKMGVFYVSFLPQFTPQGADVGRFAFLLAAIHAAMGVAWLGLLALGAARIAPAFSRPGVLKAVDRATGGLFLALGARLALDPR